VKDNVMDIKDLRESVQSGTDNLKLGRYLRMHVVWFGISAYQGSVV
jgi:hypothetical protein